MLNVRHVSSNEKRRKHMETNKLVESPKEKPPAHKPFSGQTEAEFIEGWLEAVDGGIREQMSSKEPLNSPLI